MPSSGPANGTLFRVSIDQNVNVGVWVPSHVCVATSEVNKLQQFILDRVPHKQNRIELCEQICGVSSTDRRVELVYHTHRAATKRQSYGTFEPR